MFSGALHDKHRQEQKFHLVKGRLKQIRVKTFLKAPVDLHFVIDPGRAFHSLGATVPKPLSLLRETFI